jgi:hypothetical protein
MTIVRRADGTMRVWTHPGSPVRVVSDGRGFQLIRREANLIDPRSVVYQSFVPLLLPRNPCGNALSSAQVEALAAMARTIFPWDSGANDQ